MFPKRDGCYNTAGFHPTTQTNCPDVEQYIISSCENTIRFDPMEPEATLRRDSAENWQSERDRKWVNDGPLSNPQVTVGESLFQYVFSHAHHIQYDFLGSRGTSINKIQIFCPVPWERLRKFKLLVQLNGNGFQPLLDLKVKAYKSLNSHKDAKERNNIWSGKVKELLRRKIYTRRNHFEQKKPYDDKTYLDEKLTIENIWSDTDGLVVLPFHTKQTDISFNKISNVTAIRIIVLETDYQGYFGAKFNSEVTSNESKVTSNRCSFHQYGYRRCKEHDISISKVMFLETLPSEGESSPKMKALIRRGLPCGQPKGVWGQSALCGGRGSLQVNKHIKHFKTDFYKCTCQA